MKPLYRFIYALIYPFVQFLYPSRVEGLENLPEGGAVICANHSDNVDPLMLLFSIGRHHPIRILGKHEMSNWFLVGSVLSRLDVMIWVKRGESDISAVKSCLKTLKEGRKLMVFPEGTRSSSIGSGKNGAVMFAIRSGVPIVPVYISSKKRLFRPSKVIFGNPYIPFHENRKPTLDDYTIATSALMERIIQLGGAEE